MDDGNYLQPTIVGHQCVLAEGDAFSEGSGAELSDTDLQQNAEISMQQQFATLTAFQADEAELLRGVELVKVFRACGIIFKGSKGSHHTFALSERVVRLSFFLSHNWSVPRILKFLALAFHFNFRVAAASAVICTCFIAVLQVSGVLWADVPQRNTRPYGVGFMCRLCALPVFALALCFYQELVKCTRRRTPMCFLDKVCIHQVNPDLMRRGISKLGAYIQKSDAMLVLYTDVYLQKVWTTYEVASHLILHPERQMVIIPVHQVATYCFVLVGLYVNSNLSIVYHCTSDFGSYLRLPIDAFIGILCMVAVRRWQSQCRQAQHRLTTFSIHDCICAVETDRQVVYENIILLMKAAGRANMHDSHDEVLKAFNELVRHRLPPAFEDMLSSREFVPLSYLVFIGFMVVGAASLDTIAAFGHGRPFREVAAMFMQDAFWTIVGWPTAFRGAARLASVALHLKGLREIALVTCFMFFGVMPPCVGVHLALVFLRTSAVRSDLALVSLALITVSSAVATIAGPGVRRWCGSRLRNDAQVGADTGTEFVDDVDTGLVADPPQPSPCINTSSGLPQLADTQVPESKPPGATCCSEVEVVYDVHPTPEVLGRSQDVVSSGGELAVSSVGHHPTPEVTQLHEAKPVEAKITRKDTMKRNRILVAPPTENSVVAGTLDESSEGAPGSVLSSKPAEFHQEGEEKAGADLQVKQEVEDDVPLNCGKALPSRGIFERGRSGATAVIALSSPNSTAPTRDIAPLPNPLPDDLSDAPSVGTRSV